VIVVLSLLQVVYRYGFSMPLNWIEELARLLLVWAVCLGAAAATKSSAHLRIDFITNAGGESWQRLWSVIADVVVGAVAVGMVIYGIEFYRLTAGDDSTSLGFARNLYYLPVAIGGVLIFAFSLTRIVFPRYYREDALTSEEGSR
jgi:C4-dicarboxylate transporter DctQ subunit